ncbi:ankyrin repeat [Pyrenophora seminiperda CCB06]|uniref:Ankyrin repeat n=1 Tax=Pyrenophora seminiperda CCB06 TaxID=1302712 RepID=A0A3M7MA29_9PLEO|nr:ankyrin repeat [Pyrenophora seminiperda CCB06]
MFECRHDLLFRENASGRTPFEMAKDIYLANDVSSNPSSLSGSGHWHYHSEHCRRSHGQSKMNMLIRNPKTFIKEPEDEYSGDERVLQVCKEFADKSDGKKRKLVSLLEPNEVAKDWRRENRVVLRRMRTKRTRMKSVL